MKIEKILRQGLIVTPKQLRELADKLEQETYNIMVIMGEVKNNIDKIRHLVPIINKQKCCSDTWEIEK